MSQEVLSYNKNIPIYDKADIIVAGGGPSGVAASVTAARQGKKVILLEQSGSLGGASILSMVAAKDADYKRIQAKIKELI